MLTLNQPEYLFPTNVTFEQKALESGNCGLFRCPLPAVKQLMPTMSALVDSMPLMVHANAADWEVDIKVHMLMAGQYPCIPNWHCDNVPRDEGGTRYDLLKDPERHAPPMFLWISDGPETEFLAEDLMVTDDFELNSHRDVAKYIRQTDAHTRRILPQAWYKMDQLTPHRGRAADFSGWRVFCRLSHKSIAPARPVNHHIRRHAQVYLDASEFSW